MARPKGVGGRPGAGHSPPTSWRAGARRPCRPPQRSLPSCPSEVSAPPGIRGKLRPDAGRLLDSRWGAGPGRPGRGCAAGSRRRPTRSRSSCIPEPRLQAARRGRGVGRRASAAGGGRRLEAGAGGGREAGRAGGYHPGWVEGAPRWGARGQQPPRAPGLRFGAPTLFLPASTLRQVREARRLGSSGPREGCWPKWKGRCTKGPGTRRWQVRGHRGGTSLLRIARLGPSPRV